MIAGLILKYINSSTNKATTALTYSLTTDNTPPTWTNEAYRTIILDEPATGDFLTWLQKNAVKQEK